MIKNICLVLIFIYFLFIIDYLFYRYLKYWKKDEKMQNINYNLNWWHDYFIG